jgi:hypothetical protein
MTRKTSRKHSGLKVEFPPPFVPMRLDQVLWDFAQFYGKLFRADHPDLKLSIDQAVLAGALAFEERGVAVRYTDPDGGMTWKATPKFLRETGLEPGGLVTIGPFTSTQ